ncbi:hypothetical protein OPQ81_002724 [Rhizoctonia solani]|nr:hypothetical protein OPQ81_011864 [Rhizoctonia solani]KAJ1302406.1 hypothetical protein OPQ81_002724 [Rhizoctonia solani]
MTYYAVCLVTNSNTVGTYQATNLLLELTGEDIHLKTVCCAPKWAGLNPKKKVKKPKFTSAHQKAHYEFAEAHKHWTVEDWKQVLWSDETKINCLQSDGVHWAWIWPGEEDSEQLVLPTANFGAGSLMFGGVYGMAVSCPNP